MRSILAGLRNLVLPWGATSGQRIVMDSTTAQIAIYDAAGNVVVSLDATKIHTVNPANGAAVDVVPAGADIVLSPPTPTPPTTAQAGAVYPTSSGAVPQLVAKTPTFNGLAAGVLTLSGRAAGVASRPILDWSSSQSGDYAEMQANGTPIGQGWLTGQRATSNSANADTSGTLVTHTAGAAIFRSDRVYEVRVFGRLGNVASGCTAGAIHLHKGTDTSLGILADFGYFPVPVSAGSAISGRVLLYNGTGADITTQLCVAVQANVGTCQWLGAANSPSGFTVMDVGAGRVMNNNHPSNAPLISLT